MNNKFPFMGDINENFSFDKASELFEEMELLKFDDSEKTLQTVIMDSITTCTAVSL